MWLYKPNGDFKFGVYTYILEVVKLYVNFQSAVLLHYQLGHEIFV